jgi:hypothetical protein
VRSELNLERIFLPAGTLRYRNEINADDQFRLATHDHYGWLRRPRPTAVWIAMHVATLSINGVEARIRANKVPPHRIFATGVACVRA